MDDNMIIDGMILQCSIHNFPIRKIPAGTKRAQTVCTRLFSPYPHKSLGTRL